MNENVNYIVTCNCFLYNIIVIGKYGNKEKEELIKYFGNPSKSYLNIGKKEYSESDLKNNETSFIKHH